MAEKQSRSFMGVVYPDSESYDCQEVLDRLKIVFDEWAYITHDMDVDEQGELKKAHIHWVGKRSPAPASTVANGLGLQAHEIELVKSWKYAVRYLIHMDHPDKYQYDPKSVVSNFDCQAVFAEKNDSMKSKKIYDYIMMNPSVELEGLLQWCFENDLWGTFKSQWALWNFLLNKNHVKGSV